MSKEITDISRRIGTRTQEYLSAYELLKHLLDDESKKRIQDFISGMQEARQVVHEGFEL